MARSCELCGRGPQFGYRVSHAKNRTKRVFHLNLQKTTLVLRGATRRMRVCANCLRSLERGISPERLMA
ncbi:MAG: 50S ribosomal protein L28 [Chloroflexi bacterium]|nr:50S ribosomal protein L28 [Chloroflexota bacterium]